jgi:UDPglucose 6-dehydrogenase
VGADAVDVIRGMSYDRRIGADHLAPGPGWGGSCFPKDTSALLRIAEDHGYDFALLREVIAANDAQFEWVANQVERAAGGSLDGMTVAAWGLTFKAATDDLRDSPALSVLRRLQGRGAVIKAYDPTLPDPDNGHLKGLTLSLSDDPYAACAGAQALVILTEWPEFRELDWPLIAHQAPLAVVVDTRNVLDVKMIADAGLTYLGNGTPSGF